jgi:hypothetical protein
MWVQITTDWIDKDDRNQLTELDSLISNMEASDAFEHGSNSIDMREQLESRGWYEGTHGTGRYLVVNLDRLELQSKLQPTYKGE